MTLIVSPTERVHVVRQRPGNGWITTLCGIDFPVRTVWPIDGAAISCVRCRRLEAAT